MYLLTYLKMRIGHLRHRLQWWKAKHSSVAYRNRQIWERSAQFDPRRHRRPRP